VKVGLGKFLTGESRVIVDLGTNMTSQNNVRSVEVSHFSSA